MLKFLTYRPPKYEFSIHHFTVRRHKTTQLNISWFSFTLQCVVTRGYDTSGFNRERVCNASEWLWMDTLEICYFLRSCAYEFQLTHSVEFREKSERRKLSL